MTETTHPAVLASMNSAKFAMAGDKQSWLSLFDDDAFLADPVGPSPFDPSGNGQRGKAAIEGFWSPSAVIAEVKWGVAGALTVLVAAYLALAGRGSDA